MLAPRLSFHLDGLANLNADQYGLCMTLYGARTEYVLHSLLWLVENKDPVSSLDLAELQNIPSAFMAKLLPILEKAGILTASEGVRGGYQLALPAQEVNVLDVVDAVEGRKSLFNCLEIRGRCALFETPAPQWATQGVCGIHAVMIKAENAMRQELAQTTLADLAAGVKKKAPPPFPHQVQSWLQDRVETRRSGKVRQRKRENP